MYVYLLGTLQCRFLLFIRVGSMVSGSLASCQGSYLSLFLLDVVYVHLYFPTCDVCICHGYCIILVVVCHYEYTSTQVSLLRETRPSVGTPHVYVSQSRVLCPYCLLDHSFSPARCDPPHLCDSIKYP